MGNLTFHACYDVCSRGANNLGLANEFPKFRKVECVKSGKFPLKLREINF